MIMHRVCCCSPGPCVCTGCDFATSYVVSCLNLYGSWNYDAKFNLPCTYVPCEGNSEEAVVHEVDVSVNITFNSGTLTRSTTETGGCCYSRTGTATIAYNIVIRDKGACCHHAANVCTVVTTLIGTRDVDYCHTVTPQCRNGTECSWRHMTSVCPFYISVEDVLNEVGPGDCSDFSSPLDCENLPLDRVGIALGGARWQWWSDYVDLDTLMPIDFRDFSFCSSPDTCACTHTLVSARGPFSVYYLPDWGGTRPSDCIVPSDAGSPYYLGSWTGCDGTPTPATTACEKDLDYTDTCCNREFHFNVSAPCYS